MEPTWAVLLESYSELPHMKFGEDFHRLLGAFVEDANLRLRHQKGIVWEDLPEGKAKTVAAFLNQNGFKSRVVPQEEVMRPGSMSVWRKGKIIRAGLSLDDWFGKRLLIPRESMALAQAGWITQEVEASQGIPGTSTDSRVFSHFEGIYRVANLTMKSLPREEIGWVLQIFGGDVNPDWKGYMGGVSTTAMRAQPREIGRNISGDF
jgi:hypothetical protein